MLERVIGLPKYELDTPCLILDIDALEYNLQLMQQHGLKHKVNIRPHAKTHKCSRLAKHQLQFGAIGICTTKLSEAEILVNNGINDVLITSPIVSQQKIKKLLNLIKLAPGLMVVTDNLANISDLNNAAASVAQVINVLVDVDAGIGRTGCSPASAVELAKNIDKCQWLMLRGIQCYAGNLQHVVAYEIRKNASIKAMKMAGKIINFLKEKKADPLIFTGSGTGTYDIDIDVAEVTEIQPGSYAVMDVEYYLIGTKNSPKFTTFKHALTLLTTVISSNRKEHVTVDAGTKAIYVDQIKPQIINRKNLSYDWAGFGDEHGKVLANSNESLPVNGDVLELIVPHCDPTINLFDTFYITKNNRVVDVWDIDLRGKSQ